MGYGLVLGGSIAIVALEWDALHLLLSRAWGMRSKRPAGPG
jgi:hypothetical protein